MVQNPRTPVRPHQLRPLNLPRSVTVEVADSRPVALVDAAGARLQIVAIEEEWMIDDEWWRERIQRQYMRVRLAHGPVRTIFRDGESGRWFEQTY